MTVMNGIVRSDIRTLNATTCYRSRSKNCRSLYLNTTGYHATRAPIRQLQYRKTKPLELIHLDISGKVNPALSGSCCTVAFLDAYTAKSDVKLVKASYELFNALVEVELQHRGLVLRNIRLNRAVENSSDIVNNFCTKNGIKLDYFPTYGSQINGAAERIIR